MLKINVFSFVFAIFLFILAGKTNQRHEVHVGSLTKISEIPYLPKHDFGRAASMVNIQTQRFGKSGSTY